MPLRTVRLGWFVLHFSLIALVCIHESLGLLDKHLTVVPVTAGKTWHRVDKIPAAIVGDSLPPHNTYRKIVLTYLNAAGIEIGYGYFAPNVPEAHALVFEWHYPEDRVTYDSPRVESSGGDLRLTSLIDQIGRTDYNKWREELMRRLAVSAWQRHPDATSVRIFLGSVAPPSLADYRAGKKARTFVLEVILDLKSKSAGIQATGP